MRYFKQVAGIVVWLGLTIPCLGESISFVNIAQDSAAEDAAGIHIIPTGPANLPVVQGKSEVLGVTSGFLVDSITANYYSAKATLDHPATRLSLTVTRENNSNWYDSITLTGFDNGKRVASTKVGLPPLGDTAKVTISAPAIDQFTWDGNGWVYHPYVVARYSGLLTQPLVGARAGHLPITPCRRISRFLSRMSTRRR